MTNVFKDGKHNYGQPAWDFGDAVKAGEEYPIIFFSARRAYGKAYRWFEKQRKTNLKKRPR